MGDLLFTILLTLSILTIPAHALNPDRDLVASAKAELAKIETDHCFASVVRSAAS